MTSPSSPPSPPPGKSSPGPGRFNRLRTSWQQLRKKPLWLQVLAWLSVLPALLLVENLILLTPLVSMLAGLAPPLTLSYGYAWSIIPGRVHVHDLHIVVEDRAVQVQLDADSAEASFVLSALFERRIHIDEAKVKGLHFRFRPVLSKEAAQAPWVKTFPAIDGLSELPLFDDPERPRPPTERLFKIQIENINAELNEVWLGPLHLKGDGAVQGGFELHPRQMLHLQPTSVRFSHHEGQATLLVGEKTLSDRAEFRLDAALEPFVFKQDKEILQKLSLHILGKFPFESLAALDPMLPHQHFGLGAGEGVLNLNLAINQGEFKEGSVISLHAEQAGLSIRHPHFPYEFAGSLSARVGVKKGEKRHHLSAEARFQNLKLKNHELTTQPATISLLQGQSSVALGPDLSLEPLTSSVQLKDFRLPDLRIFNSSLADTPVQLTTGHASLNLHGEAKGIERLHAQLELKVFGAGVSVHTGKERLQLALGAHLKGETSFQDGKLKVAPLTLQVSPFLVDWEGRKLSWPFVVSTTHSVVELKNQRELSYFALQGPSLKPVVEAFVENGAADFAADLVLGKGDTSGQVRVEHQGQAMQIDLLDFQSGRLTLDGVLLALGKELKGALLIMGPILRVGITLASEKKLVHLTASRAWLERELASQKITRKSDAQRRHKK